jgi:hypothetical protein
MMMYKRIFSMTQKRFWFFSVTPKGFSLHFDRNSHEFSSPDYCVDVWIKQQLNSWEMQQERWRSRRPSKIRLEPIPIFGPAYRPNQPKLVQTGRLHKIGFGRSAGFVNPCCKQMSADCLRGKNVDFIHFTLIADELLSSSWALPTSSNGKVKLHYFLLFQTILIFLLIFI